MSETTTETSPRCARCNQEIAEGQRVEHRGAVYCIECVGKVLNGDAASRQGRKHSVAAAVRFSLIPGLGQMYNGQMRRGAEVLFGFLALWACAATLRLPELLTALLGVAIPVFYFWNLFDAYWTAQRINRFDIPVLPPVSEEERSAWDAASAWRARLPQIPPGPYAEPSGASAAWGVFLIALGVLFLFNNFGVKWLTWDRVWPTALLALGIWLLISFALSRREPPAPEPPHEEAQNG
jgi:TM2 domain-containing membrane protein YozV